MSSTPLHLLTLAPVSAEDKVKLEATFDSVHYGESPELAWNSGPPVSLSSDVYKNINVIFGWQLPADVTAFKQVPNLIWQMTPSAGSDVSVG
jgi:hypothetical protein